MNVICLGVTWLMLTSFPTVMLYPFPLIPFYPPLPFGHDIYNLWVESRYNFLLSRYKVHLLGPKCSCFTVKL